MLRLFVNGWDGHMGTILCNIIDETEDLELVALQDKPEVIIDFSHFSMLDDLLDFALANNTPLVIATTGYSSKQLEQIREASAKVPIFHSSNMSLGVALVSDVAKQIAAKFGDCDIEIVETHHNRKADAPSGTALMLADSIREAKPEKFNNVGRSGNCPREKSEIGISSIRTGNVVGIHEIIFGTNNQTIKLIHEAHDRALFADGAIVAARFIKDQAPGLYGMKDLI